MVTTTETTTTTKTHVVVVSPIPVTTEYLQWCITWTLAYPCIAFQWLCCTISTNNNDDNENTNVSLLQQRLQDSLPYASCCNTRTDDCNRTISSNQQTDEFLWLSYISFHCIWNETKAVIPKRSKCRQRIPEIHRPSKDDCDDSTATTKIYLPRDERIESQLPTLQSIFDEKTTTTTTTAASTVIKWKNSLGYGEITEIAVFQILHYLNSIRSHSHHHNNHHHDHHHHIRNIIDLGSGTGRVVLASAIAVQQQQSPNKNIVLGIEIVPNLHNQAIQLVSRWNAEQQFLFSVTSSSSSSSSTSSLNFHPSETPIIASAVPSFVMTQLNVHCDDFMKNYQSWIRSVDLIFIHGTVFEDSLWVQIYHMILGTHQSRTFPSNDTKSTTTKNLHRDDLVPTGNDENDDNDNDCENDGCGAKVGTFIVSVSRPLSLHLHRNCDLQMDATTTSLTMSGNGSRHSPYQNHHRHAKKTTDGEDSFYLRDISELNVEMSWGRGIVYIQQVCRRRK